MPPLSSPLWSSVGRKLINGLTGLLLVIFLIEHLTGNFLLLDPDSQPFNRYSDFLIGLGEVLIVVELGLVAVFLLHVITATTVFLSKLKARPVGYEKTKSAGNPSHKTLSSVTMIWTGLVLFVFIFIHVKTFKYGPGIAEGYVVTVHGEQMRDLYRLVYEVFKMPGYVVWYTASMILLGFHLRHGFWSAFQTLGLNHPRYNRVIYALGWLVALVLAIGFIFIPVWIYFTGVIPQ